MKPTTPERLAALLKNFEPCYLAGNQRWIRRNRTIADVEATWFRLHEAEQRLWREKIRPLIQQIYDKGGKAHCIPVNSAVNGGQWWEYEVSNQGKAFGQKFCLAYSSHWIPKPSKPVLHKLGQEFYELNRRHESRELVNQCMARELLARRLLDFLNQHYPLPPALDGSQIKDLVVNGRHYVFIGEYGHKGAPHWANKTWAAALEPTLITD